MRPISSYMNCDGKTDPRLAVIHAHIQECVIKGEAEGNRAEVEQWHRIVMHGSSVNMPLEVLSTYSAVS